jgi:hypothetical protein
MAERAQTYGTHRRFIPQFHFFVLPVLFAQVVLKAVQLVRDPTASTAWLLIVAVALLVGIYTARPMALRAQDRIIRLEESARLGRLLPADLRGRIGELTTRQFIAIRFAPDDEVPDLTRRVLDGELESPGDIKRAIRNWRADHLRV